MNGCVEQVAPVANRALIFTTDVASSTATPSPAVPARRVPESLALYYFTSRMTAPCPVDGISGPSG